MYSFTIPYAKNLSLDRIIRNNEDVRIYATIVPCKNGDLLLISNMLLAQFDSINCWTVAGQSLSSSWGTGGISLYEKDGELILEAGATANWVSTSQGMVMQVDPKYRTLHAAELNAALQRLQAIKVTVLQFEAGAFV